jgi:hypothetical protein
MFLLRLHYEIAIFMLRTEGRVFRPARTPEGRPGAKGLDFGKLIAYV